MLKKIVNLFKRKSRGNTGEPMSKKVLGLNGVDLSQSATTLDVCLTKLVWEKALRSNDDGVAVAIRQLMTALENAEKNSDAGP